MLSHGDGNSTHSLPSQRQGKEEGSRGGGGSGTEGLEDAFSSLYCPLFGIIPCARLCSNPSDSRETDGVPLALPSANRLCQNQLTRVDSARTLHALREEAGATETCTPKRPSCTDLISD
ncbi:hypothetical protein AMELA_G00187510 [Ameiurus melas]|uniref:Uncharacterized protein n=1 Tax=Ameiurus melas TaxID=219545 RepID=A0A7J6A808_AMEME|nr:hypothetical protein AMELA_G00187510 [Ameiurus melas]